MDDAVIEYLVGGKRFAELKFVDGFVYRFDKLIFGGFVLIMLALFVLLFVAFGSDRNYHLHYVCNADARDGSVCQQPFYLNFPVCESVWEGACWQKLVPTGFEYGKPAPWIVQNWGVVIGVLLSLAFLLNHLLHNRKVTA